MIPELLCTNNTAVFIEKSMNFGHLIGFRAEFNSKRALECISAAADKAQHLNTQRLAERDHEILRWKTEVEHAIVAMTEEIKLLTHKRVQARQAGASLAIVSNIASECMGRRALREGYDLQRDKVEEELVKVRKLGFGIHLWIG